MFLRVLCDAWLAQRYQVRKRECFFASFRRMNGALDVSNIFTHIMEGWIESYYKRYFVSALRFRGLNTC